MIVVCNTCPCAAQRQGFRVIGVVGILLEGKAQKRIQGLRPHLDALRQSAGFYLSNAVYERALELANEQD